MHSYVAYTSGNIKSFSICLTCNTAVTACNMHEMPACFVLLTTCSIRFKVKPEGGQQCFVDVFLTKPVGINENLGVKRQQRGLPPPPPPDKSSTDYM